jgi:Glyoxalase-like domain
MHAMTANARLGGVSLDGDDPHSLAAFWRDLLELEVMFESEDFVALKGAGVLITTQRVANHQPPDWPETTIPKQIHLELAVTDLDAVEGRALELGAVKASTQPNPDVWRVLQDPAGHPFCLTTMIPEV